MKKFLRILIGIAIIAGVCVYLAEFKGSKVKVSEPDVTRPVRTMALEGFYSNFSKNYFGTVKGGRRVDLSFRVSGPLKQILVEKGAAVKKGDLLATLDARDFNTQLRRAQSAQSQAQAQYSDALTNFKRYENLYKQRAVSKAQYDAASTQVDVTRSAVSAAAAAAAAARDALRDTELRAPFAGIIADRMVENFQDIMAKQTIFSLQDIDTLEIVFNIPDNDILLAPLPKDVSLEKLLQSDKKAFTLTAHFEAMPDKIFPLSLKEFAAQADPHTNTYPATATMPQQKDFKILPGMAVTVEVNFHDASEAKSQYQSKDEENKYDRFAVPATAILARGVNENYVWVLNNLNNNNEGEVHTVPVIIERPLNHGKFEITGSQLKKGDIIVTAGVHFLREKQKVRLMQSEKAN